MPGSVSSLLRSAEARKRKIQEQQDSLVAFEYSQSAKTLADYQAYSSYLREQANKTTDPSKLLSYTKTDVSARRSYVSNEIQRATINTLEGRGTTLDKRGKVEELYYSAMQNGDLELAQGLIAQYDQLDVQLQREAQAAQETAAQLANLRAKSFDDAVETLKGYTNDLNKLLQAGSSKEIADYAKQINPEGGGGFFDAYMGVVESIDQLYQSALASESDPDNLRKLQKDYNELSTKKQFELPAANGGSIMVSPEDLKKQIKAARVGESIFEPVQTANGTAFVRNQQTGFVWGKNEFGQYEMIPLYNKEPNYQQGAYKQRTQVNSEGNPTKIEYLNSKGEVVAIRDQNGNVTGVNGKNIQDAEKQNYEELLKQAGYNVNKEGGVLRITPTNTTGANIIPGLLPTESALVYVGEDGTLQTKVGDQVYDFSFDEMGKLTGVNEYRKNPITNLNDRFSGAFVSMLQDKGILDQLASNTVGIVDQAQLASQMAAGGIHLQPKQPVIAPNLNPVTAIQQAVNPLQQAAKTTQLQRALSIAPPPTIQKVQNTITGTQLMTAPKGTTITPNTSNKATGTVSVNSAKPTGSISIGNKPSSTPTITLGR